MKHDDEIRYSRSISLPEIGKKGQEKLLTSKVLMIGAGGLGSASLLYLAGAGIGKIGIVDDDQVELSNLHRQIIYETSDIGATKTESASLAALDLNPNIEIDCHNIRINKDNIAGIIADYDIVLEGSDSPDTKFLVSDYCYRAKKPLILGAVQGFFGQISTFKAYLGGGNPCYRCLYPDPSSVSLAPNCLEAGVLGSVVGIIGVWQSIEAIKELLNIGESISGSLIIFEALSAEVRKLKITRNKSCSCCGAGAGAGAGLTA